jgi:hypothetical protein
MVNYNLGKIYKIEPRYEHNEGDIYIGSTAQKYLSNRFQKHRGDYKSWKLGVHNRKTMSFDLFEKYGMENCKITLIENVNVNTIEELLAKERYYIQSLKCVNKIVPLRTHREWQIDNAEYVKNYDKKYREENKERLLNYSKEYRKDNQENIKQIAKQYYDKNSEKIKEQKRIEYHLNIEECRLKQTETTICNCGCEITKNHLKRHQLSIKHQNLINKIEV